MRVRERLAASRQPEFGALRERLLTIGGREVKPAPGWLDNAIDELLQRGELMRFGISLLVMQSGHCNGNVARIWLERGPQIHAMCTGYALDANDGTVWRQHWWGLTTEPRIIETTVARSRYFGICFTGVSADGVATDILREVRTWRRGNESGNLRSVQH
jgi:hypothetical protein